LLKRSLFATYLEGGDLPKWIAANLSFVFGIDISKNNIENRISGACARYLSFRKDFQNMPHALFVVGNSALNIRSGKAMLTDKGNSITQAVFGLNALDKNLGPAVKRQYAKGDPGFDVSSCQFAVHYMFENKHTFYNFMRNVAECTKEGGYFVGTCYDGKSVFNKLKMKAQGDGDAIYHNERKVWSLTKDYDAVSFEDNITSLGYKISVYQESINQTISEYLVNFDFLVETMSNYGFRLLPRDDAKKIGLPEGSGLFIEMYNKMMDEIRKFPKTEKEYGMAPSMMDYEKRISFLNRYFVFQKTATRNVEKLTKSILEHVPHEFEFEDRHSAIAEKAVKETKEKIKPKVKKLKIKLKLQNAVEAPIEAPIKAPIEAPVKEVVKEVAKEVAEEHILEKKKISKVKKTKKVVEVTEVAKVLVEDKPEKKKTTRKKKILGEFEEKSD
jgi:SAM-dependent methyltransferase